VTFCFPVNFATVRLTKSTWGLSPMRYLIFLYKRLVASCEIAQQITLILPPFIFWILLIYSPVIVVLPVPALPKIVTISALFLELTKEAAWTTVCIACSCPSVYLMPVVGFTTIGLRLESIFSLSVCWDKTSFSVI
jgi:hypothetical protein